MSAKSEIKKAVCTWCKGNCGVLVHVNDNHLVKVEPDPDWPKEVYPPNKGCVRRKAAVEWFYHRDRVNYPLKRAGEKGEGKWQRISWNQALDEIAQELGEIKEKCGGEAIANCQGTSYRFERPTTFRFLRLLGAVNSASSGNVCFIPRAYVADAIVGMFPHFSVKPVTKCIVLLGAEALVSRPRTAAVLFEAVKRGAKLVVIDPRRTRSASMADIHLQVRPGTDCALLLGIINLIIQEELFDRNFVEKWCHGFDQLRARSAEYLPERVARITDVPAEKIAEAARVYATNRPGCMIEGMGIEELQQNAEILHARWILAALVGNIDIEGGEELTGPHPHILSPVELQPPVILPPGQAEKQLLGGKFKLLNSPGQKLIAKQLRRVWGKLPLPLSAGHGPTMYRSILSGEPYAVKAMITTGSNPMVTQPNTKMVYKALKKLDLHVVHDAWLTPSAELADYVLPAACWLEKPILWDFHGYADYMIAGEAALPAVIPGEYEHKDEFEVSRELGIKMGQEAYWPWRTQEEYYDELLKPIGMTHREYVYKVRYEQRPVIERKYEKVGFATPTGKVELYSTIFESLGYDPLPKYVEPPETPVSNPELASEYPLTLITGGRILEFYHSESRQVDSIRRRHPYPIVQIHPDTAQKLGIEAGDWVWIKTPRGRVRQKAQLFDGMEPNIVHAEHGWWFPELPGEEPWLHGVWEVNINVVIDDDPKICNPLTGAFPLRTALCKVYRVKEY